MGQITSARIKLSSESEWHSATWTGSLVTGDSTFDDNGDPVYPENNLQLNVDVPEVGTFDYTATVYVKQGIVGALEDVLEDVLKAEGSLDVGLELVESNILQAETRIKSEQSRLENVEERLILKYARLEKTLTLLQQQMNTVSMLFQATFGSTWA